jgi:hypothetical protein
MNDDAQANERAEALKRAADLELDWQDARAQRQRAAELFHSAEWKSQPEELED